MDLTVRAFRPADLPRVAELINAADQVDRIDTATSPAELASMLMEPTADVEHNCFLAEVDETLIGYFRVWPLYGQAESRIVILGAVRPSWRGQGVGARLLEAGIARARELRRSETTHLDAVNRKDRPDFAALLTSRGFRPVRYGLRMRRDLSGGLPEMPLPPGFVVCSVLEKSVAPRDSCAAFNAAFADHWGHVDYPVESWEYWTRQPSYDPRGDFFAYDAQGKAAGFVYACERLDHNQRTGEREGEIDLLGVLPAYRRRGLGRALLALGLNHLKMIGMSAAELDVDGENPNQAVRLYRSVGFVEKSRSVTYRLEI